MGMAMGGSGPRSEINVTPLIDVVLVLLIIFMVVQPLLQLGYDVNVPPNTQVNNPPSNPADQIVVSVTGKKEIYLNKEKVETKEILATRLNDLMRNRGSKIVFFSVEDTANYGDAMAIMDSVRKGGVANIGIVMDFVDPTGAPAGG